ncbi:hypothetical protein [Bernardetia litoralis]|nr:hypothetical protein [Bernardetia litoralis]
MDKVLSDYWFAEEVINKDNVEVGKFNTQMIEEIAKYYPNSITGVIAI